MYFGVLSKGTVVKDSGKLKYRRGETNIRMRSHPLGTSVGACIWTFWGVMYESVGIVQPRGWNGEWVSTSLVPHWSMWTLLAFPITQTWVLNGSCKGNMTKETKNPLGWKVKSIQCCWKRSMLCSPQRSSLPHQSLCKSELRDVSVGSRVTQFSRPVGQTPWWRFFVWS